MRFLKSSIMLVILLAVACSSRYQAPVGEIGGGANSNEGRSHRVNSGETLYAIAWMYDLDYSQLAVTNDMASPYLIFPGQILSLDVNSGRRSSAGNNRSNAPLVQTNRNTDTNTNSRSTSPPAPVRPATRTVNLSEPVVWVWPANGNIIGSFDATGVENKGIDIAGREGEQVLAAAGGEVVYAGRGLLRYGELIIIKHNEQFLSAYAHNSQLLVNEGDDVNQGQKIAELGSTGIDRHMLHFEIRLQGLPVDPLKYLPAR